MTSAPAWAQAMNRFTTYLSQDALGGPRLLRLSTIINLQKGGTALFVLALMWHYDNWRVPAWIYLALHGTYGFCWLLKHAAFRDPKWEVRVTFPGAFFSFALVLGPYWVAPYLLIAPVLGERGDPGAALLGLAVAVHTFGVVLMMAADSQKYYALRSEAGLIENGLFARTRNPNYLGEMMIYGAYAALARHWLPWAILAFVWIVLFLPNMLMKDQSLSRHPGWAAYRARTGLLLPRLAVSRRR
jgi:protein-S-isoprenylcysteine O-methyltransferase Ste14